MICPKCKAKIGLYRFEARTQSIMAQGMTCPVCGYWEESAMGAMASGKKEARIGEIYHEVDRNM